MSKNKTRSTLTLFLAFFVLFVFVFSLGVIVGKGLGGSKLENKNSTNNTVYEGDRQSEWDKRGYQSREGDSVKAAKTANGEDQDSIENDEIAGVHENPAQSEDTISDTPDKEPAVKDTQALETEVVEQPSQDIANTGTEKKDPFKPDMTRLRPEKKPEKIKTTGINDKTKHSLALPPIDQNGHYTVQIGAFINQDEAKKYAHKIKSKGYPVFLTTMNASDGKSWYRVRVGTFKDIDKAREYGEGLKTLEPEVKLVFITVNK